MHHAKTILLAFLLQLAVTVIAGAITATPPPLTVTVPMVVIHVTR